jgi:hypothetical protein
MVVKSYVDLREHENMRAHEGEAMWVMLTHIRPEKRKEFEHFLDAVLMPAAAHTNPEVFSKTRVLYPSLPNADGTYTYIFLMDPLVETGEYNISHILYDFYKPELADAYLKLWDESLARAQIEYDVVQSAW